MRNLLKIPTILAITSALMLSACGGDSTAPSGDTDPSSGLITVRVGASPVPHARILEFVQDELAADAGIVLDITEFDDFVLPNEALASGEIDANYFQHLPYLKDQIEEKGYEFEHGKGIHIEPYAAFSRKYPTFAEVPDGATIAITNDAANQIRGLRVLEAEGQLKDVQDDSNVLSLTAEQNPRGFKFSENQPEIIVQQLDDPAIDVAFVNGNFILTAGLNTDDAIATEEVEGNPNANLLAWRTDNTNEGVQKLDDLLHSDEVAAFIKETWPSGDVIAGS
ncbi:MAG: MetQ/NlpA family ABC transporter substrate-binding protein [Propionibacteriaceae bacterium]|nr:MetQ/NlpA family ABC transporter substrate-binding protein [Propionibacteriaceae bacterium]